MVLSGLGPNTFAARLYDGIEHFVARDRTREKLRRAAYIILFDPWPAC